MGPCQEARTYPLSPVKHPLTFSTRKIVLSPQHSQVIISDELLLSLFFSPPPHTLHCYLDHQPCDSSILSNYNACLHLIDKFLCEVDSSHSYLETCSLSLVRVVLFLFLFFLYPYFRTSHFHLVFNLLSGYFPYLITLSQ